MGKEQTFLNAARNGDIKTIGKLLELSTKKNGPLSSFRRSPSIACHDVNGYTPLHHASLNGHSCIVRLLLAHNAPVNLTDVRGSTPLFLAAWAGHQDIVKMLLMHSTSPANPNAQNTQNETALHSAAQHGHNAVVAILLAYGADAHIRNNCFQTALDLAAQFGRLQAVQILLRAQPNLIGPYRLHTDNARTTKRDRFTHTCLHLASRNGHKKVVESLLAAGVDVNIMTNSGSALHEAALCGKKSVVTVLLNAGIDVHAKDGNNRTALDLLKDYPPHVTYDIVAAINEYFEALSVEQPKLPARKPIYEKQLRRKTALPEVPERSTRNRQLQQSGLSNSLSNLEMTSVSANRGHAYVDMEPVKWQSMGKSVDEMLLVTYKPVYQHACKSALASPKNNNFECATAPSRSYETINLLQPAQSKQSAQHADDEKTGCVRYNCIDQYVEMREPLQRHDTIDTNNNNSTTSHSPTPECPPPTVVQAEHAILQYIQPFTSQKQAKLYNIQEQFGEEQDSVECARSTSVAYSDTVEEFVCEAPYAGLLMGSTLNLNTTEQTKCLMLSREALNSPNLVRAIKPVPNCTPKQLDLAEQRYSATGEDFSASKVWAEIDTIFETIGNEVSNVEDTHRTDLALNNEFRRSLHIRSPNELLLGITQISATTDWCHSPYALIYGEVQYNVFYLGSTIIKQLEGTLSTRKSIQKLKIEENFVDDDSADASLLANCNSSTKFLKTTQLLNRLEVGIAISQDGVKFIDRKNKHIICRHAIENINCVCQDTEDLRYFAYITKEHNLHYCHIFMVDTLERAKEIILTLGQAFEVAYQIIKAAKESAINDGILNLTNQM